MESGALSQLRIDPNSSPVVLDNPPADREPNTSPGILGSCIESLKGTKDTLGILHIDSNAVVLKVQDPFMVSLVARNANPRRRFGSSVFHGI